MKTMTGKVFVRTPLPGEGKKNVTYTSEQILDEYFGMWCDQKYEDYGDIWMTNLTNSGYIFDGLLVDHCINDWVKAHWAWEKV